MEALTSANSSGPSVRNSRVAELLAALILRPDPRLWCAGVVLGAAGTAVIGANSAILNERGVFVSLRTGGCVGLAVLALLVFWRGSHPRLGWLLLLLAYVFELAALTASHSPIPFAIGRITIPLAIVLTVYVCFAYPTGRVGDNARAVSLMKAGAAVTALGLADVLVSRTPTIAGPFTRCSPGGCPSNPLQIFELGAGPGRALSATLVAATGAFLVAAAALTLLRMVNASRLQQRSLMPLFAWTVLASLGYGFFIVVRVIDEHAALLTAAAVVVAAIIAAMPLAIGLAIGRGRMFSMAALEHVIADLGEYPSLDTLERVTAHAFADPTLKLMFWRPSVGRYVDIAGRFIEPSEIEPGRQVTRFGGDEESVLAVVHDGVLSQDPDVMEAAGAAIRLVVENARLHGDLSKSVAEIEASRKRVASAADQERRRIEQDLHDGAQQDLIALRIKLHVLEEQAATDSAAVARGLAEAGRRVEHALVQIRNLAKGVYPSALGDLGLSYALAAMIRDAPMDVSLHVDVTGRFVPEVETAVYFCCFEGLQNIAKHCGAGARVDLRVSERHGALDFVLSDTGPGFDPTQARGTRGLTGMRDRLEAVGGELVISSSPGVGTSLFGHVPRDSGTAEPDNAFAE